MTHSVDKPAQPSTSEFWDPEELPTVNNRPARNGLKKDKRTEIVTNTQPSDNNKEVGGRQGPEPTRFGDWEKNGRCVDF
ncbi:MAG: DUF1674 domain-containing protein [Magnetovibrio sp.]|nr:DUF1674 domain-containing protein [Magnetovibrio sp.]